MNHPHHHHHHHHVHVPVVQQELLLPHVHVDHHIDIHLPQEDVGEGTEKMQDITEPEEPHSDYGLCDERGQCSSSSSSSCCNDVMCKERMVKEFQQEFQQVFQQQLKHPGSSCKPILKV